MHVVAIYRLQGAPETLAPRLAEALGIVPYEARMRVQAPGGGPAVVGCFAAAAAAAECTARLQVHGFSTLQVATVEPAAQEVFVARQVFLADEGLAAEARDGARLTLPWADIRLLLRAVSIKTSTDVETREEKKFSPGMAIATAGLVLRKTIKRVEETTRQERQPFCNVYAPSLPVLVLRQEEMDYASLGAERLYSREANFNLICSRLRQRCPEAVWDERLVTRNGQTQLLGPALLPDQHLDLAVMLLARANGVSAVGTAF